jgi:hypothetical protein
MSRSSCVNKVNEAKRWELRTYFSIFQMLSKERERERPNIKKKGQKWRETK